MQNIETKQVLCVHIRCTLKNMLYFLYKGTLCLISNCYIFVISLPLLPTHFCLSHHLAIKPPCVHVPIGYVM